MARTVTTFAYNGSSWSTVSGGDLNLGTSGTFLAGNADDCVIFARNTTTESPDDATELWNGTSWSNSTDMAHKSNCGTGVSSTDAIQTSGSNDPTNQLLDGTTWSDSVDCGQNTHLSQTAGTSTDLMKASGYHYPSDNNSYTGTETLDGTTWSSGPTVINEGSYGTAWGTGSTFFLRYGGIDYNSPYGNPTPHTTYRACSYYNGTAWSNDNQAPDAGGLDGGIYNGTFQSASIGNDGGSSSGGAVYHAGSTMAFRDSHSKVETTYEMTWTGGLTL